MLDKELEVTLFVKENESWRRAREFWNTGNFSGIHGEDKLVFKVRIRNANGADKEVIQFLVNGKSVDFEPGRKGGVLKKGEIKEYEGWNLEGGLIPFRFGYRNNKTIHPSDPDRKIVITLLKGGKREEIVLKIKTQTELVSDGHIVS